MHGGLADDVRLQHAAAARGHEASEPGLRSSDGRAATVYRRSFDGGSVKGLTANDCIRAVARLGSFSAAADELGISQPALSARIKKVEQQLDASLFDRSANPLALTPAGEAYLETQDGIDALNRKLQQRLGDLNSLNTGELAIGGADLFNSTLMPRAIARFCERFPGVNVHVTTDAVPGLLERALTGSLDMFVSPVPVECSSFEFEPLFEERLFLCLNPADELVSKLPARNADGYARITKNDLAKLAQKPFIFLDKGLQMGAKLQKLLDRHGIEPARAIHVDQSSTGTALAMAGAGVALVAESAMSARAAAQRPALYLIDEDLCSRTLYAAHRSSMSRCETEFLHELRAAAQLAALD